MFFSLMSIGWGQFDTEPPEIVDFQFTSETTLDVTDEPQQLYFNLSVIDDMSGTGDCGIRFKSPSDIDSVYGSIWCNNQLECFENGDITVPQFIEPGIWIIDYIYCYDESGNDIDLNYDEIVDLGFSYEFEVINNSGFCTVEDIHTYYVLRRQTLYAPSAARRAALRRGRHCLGR